MQEARKASHDKCQAELKSISSAEQYANYEAGREQMKQKRAGGKKNRKSGEYKNKGEYRQQQQGN